MSFVSTIFVYISIFLMSLPFAYADQRLRDEANALDRDGNFEVSLGSAEVAGATLCTAILGVRTYNQFRIWRGKLDAPSRTRFRKITRQMFNLAMIGCAAGGYADGVSRIGAGMDNWSTAAQFAGADALDALSILRRHNKELGQVPVGDDLTVADQISDAIVKDQYTIGEALEAFYPKPVNIDAESIMTKSVITAGSGISRDVARQICDHNEKYGEPCSAAYLEYIAPAQ